MAAALAACGGDDTSNEGGGASGTAGSAGAAGSGGSGGAGAAPSTSCDPVPERCDAFGTSQPFRLSEHSAAYVPDRREMVVFGGSNAVPENCNFPAPDYIDETWVYDDPCGAWTQVSSTGPSARGRHASAFGDGSVWIFGGRFRTTGSTSGNYTLFDELWRFDPTARTWQLASTTGAGPSPRVNTAIAWDTQRSLLWLFGGNDSASGASVRPLNDVWSFDVQSGTWTEHSVTGPEPRLFQSMIYDAMRDRLVIFGGADATLFNPTAKFMSDLWALDLASMTWTELHVGSIGAPEGRFWSGLVHDTGNDVYLLFGGHDDGALGNRNDVWRFGPDDASWARATGGDALNSTPNGPCDFPVDFTIVDGTAPERRNAHTMVWSPSCERAIVFAGKTDCGVSDDVWDYTSGTWRERVGASEGEACLRWRDDPAACSNMCN